MNFRCDVFDAPIHVEIITNTDWISIELNESTVNIPLDWESKSIGQMGGFKTGSDHKKLGPGVVPVFGSSSTPMKVCVNRSIHPGGTFLVGRKGTIDKPFFVSTPFWCVDTAMYFDSIQGVDPNFIFHASKKVDWNALNNATGVPSLTQSSVNRIEIAIPPVGEQNLVSKILSAQESQVADLRHQAALERQRLAWLSDELLSGRLRVEKDDTVEDMVVSPKTGDMDGEVLPSVRLVVNTEWKSVEMNGEMVEIPRDWSVDKVAAVAKSTSGGTPPTGEKIYWGGDGVWITPKDMDDLDGPYLGGSERTLTKEGYSFMKNREVKSGSVVFSTRGSIGKVGCAKGEVRISQSCESFLFDAASPEFMVYFFRKQMGEIKKMGAGTTFMSITKKDIEGFSVVLPDSAEQRSIATILAAQEKQVISMECLATMEQKRLDWLSDELLSGRLRARVKKQD